jgi:hypothetical protein
MVADLTGAHILAIMERKNAAMHRKMLMPCRQLPITGFAHKAGVVGDLDMAAVVAARDMTAERCCAAGRYRRHDFELAEAEMSCVGARIGGTVNAQDTAARPLPSSRVLMKSQRGPQSSSVATR